MADSSNTVVHPPFADKQCNTCHAPHATDHKSLLTAETGELCSGCHSDIPGDTTKIVSEHQPAADGNCSGCHDPHAGKIAKLLLDKQPRLCLNCHTQIADLMNKGTAHAPAKDDCSGCHKPHSSEVKTLLAEDVPKLCLACHDGEDAGFKKQHLGLSGTQIDCRKCHEPHASDDKRLILPQKHDPFEAGACDVCHTETAQPEGEKK